MSHLTQPFAAREGARDVLGRFGPLPKNHPEVTLDRPSASAPLGTFDIPVDEINTGDTVLIDDLPRYVIESWVDPDQPHTRTVNTSDGRFELDRDARADIARTGQEPRPENDVDFAGYCHRCGQAFSQDPNYLTAHIHPRGGRDYDADHDHAPYVFDGTPEEI